jgi:hypothetical protein
VAVPVIGLEETDAAPGFDLTCADWDAAISDKGTPANSAILPSRVVLVYSMYCIYTEPEGYPERLRHHHVTSLQFERKTSFETLNLCFCAWE